MTTTEKDKARMRAYYKANREKLLAYNKAWRKAHPGIQHKYKAKNTTEAKLKRSEYNRKYREKNREKILARSRKWRAEHPHYFRDYCRNYRKQLKENENKEINYLANKIQAICGKQSN